MASQMIRLYGVANDSIVDGPGLRYTIFTQGCPHHCLGCHNPHSHGMDGGYLQSIDDIIKDIEANPLLDGVTISGGEPFLQVHPLIELVKILKQMNLHIMIYSGYTFLELLQNTQAVELLKLCDVLVDGRFMIEKRSLALPYRGSSNQRLINLSTSFQEGKVVMQDVNEYGELI